MNTFRRLSFFVICLIMTTVSNAYDASVDGIYYNLDTNEMTAEVTNKGNTNSGAYEGEIIIPESISVNGKKYSVTSIGNNAFSSCSGLTSITIPSSVISIGNNAFGRCSGLTSITIPNSVISIGDRAFRDCTVLKELFIADGDQILRLGYNPKIGNVAASGLFKDCPLQTLYLGRNLSYYYDIYDGKTSPFYKITSLNAVTVGGNVTSITDYTFSGCSGLESLTIADSDKTLNLGNSDTSDRGLFYNCPLRTLYLGRNLSHNTASKYGSSPFCGEKNALSTLEIGKYVTSIDANMFVHFGLSSIKVDPNNTIYDSREECNAIIETSTNTIIKGTASTIIPSSIISIADNAFIRCIELASITIPSNVISIGNFAFKGCSNLKNLFIADGDQTLQLGYNQSYNSSVLSMYGQGLFYNCPLETLYLGRNLSYNTSSDYGSSPFAGNSIHSVTIGNSVTSISDNAFSGCRSLSSMDIPNSVMSIGNSAFSGCTGLSSIIIPHGVTSIGNSAFSGCTSLSSIDIPNSVMSIGNSAFSGCTGLSSIIIPHGVTSIGNSAFSGCTSLSSIDISNSVTSIGSSAFYGCTELSSVTIPNNMTSINDYTFSDCI